MAKQKKKKGAKAATKPKAVKKAPAKTKKAAAKAKAKTKPSAKNKAAARRKTPTEPRFRKSKTPNFLEKIREDNSMVEYMTKLRVMNPAATLTRQLNEPRREGGFVRLAHANEEFTAPVLTKGKSVASREKIDENKGEE
jgi:hypothetical protein